MVFLQGMLSILLPTVPLEAARTSGTGATSPRSLPLAPSASAPQPRRRSCPGSEAPPKSAAQSLAAPSHGGGEDGGGGTQGNKTGQEAQAGSGHSGPGTNSQHRKPQPTPAHPTRPQLWESRVPGTPTGARARGEPRAREDPELSSPPRVPAPTWGGGEEAGLAGTRCRFKSTEIPSGAQPSSGFTGRKGAWEPVGQAVAAGISPTGPNISGPRLPPGWHFLPPGTCPAMGMGEGPGTTPEPVGDPSLWTCSAARHTWAEGDFPSPDAQKGGSGTAATCGPSPGLWPPRG